MIKHIVIIVVSIFFQACYGSNVISLSYITNDIAYSKIHGCYVFGHDYIDDKAYISFFHGQYFNYLGSIDLGVRCDAVHDLDVVDEHHFILITFDSFEGRNSILLYNNSSKNLIFLNAKTNNSEPAANKWFDKQN